MLAERKADTALLAYPDACVCGFDTVVECQDTILGKPSDLQHAREMLALYKIWMLMSRCERARPIR